MQTSFVSVFSQIGHCVVVIIFEGIVTTDFLFKGLIISSVENKILGPGWCTSVD